MKHHIVIGGINLLVAALNLVGGLQFFLRRGTDHALLSAGAATVFLVGLLALVAGAGLLRARSWARVPACIVGAALLVVIPVGTAFGVYTFVGLADEETRAALGA